MLPSRNPQAAYTLTALPAILSALTRMQSTPPPTPAPPILHTLTPPADATGKAAQKPRKTPAMKLAPLSKQQRRDGWHYLVCTTADGRQRAARVRSSYAPAALAWVAKQWDMIGGKWKRVDA